RLRITSDECGWKKHRSGSPALLFIRVIIARSWCQCAAAASNQRANPPTSCHIGCRLILTETLERRMSQQTVASQGAIFHLRDEFGLKPVDVAALHCVELVCKW